MTKPFSGETPNYRADAALTPYQRAQQAWDDRIGSARVQAKNWRFMAVLSTLIALILLILLVLSLSMDHAVVYVAQVGQGGQIINVAPLNKPYVPTQAEKEYFLGRFIQLMRGVPLDPVVAKQNWLEAYQFLSQRGATKLNAMMQANDPVALLGKETITVTISDINPISDNSYHADWSERVVDSNGKLIATNTYSGTFTMMVKSPTSQEMILKNPLGIYIIDFNISKRDTNS